MKKSFLVIFLLIFLISCKKEKIEIDKVEVTTINTLQIIQNDMAYCGEAAPHGVPTWYDWRDCPRVGYGNNPQHLKAVVPWGQVYETSQGSKSVNTRVQIRNLYVYYLSKSKKEWFKWTGSPDVAGANFVEDFNGNANIPPDNVRKETDGSISVKLVSNYNFHFWSTQGRVFIDTTDIAGVWSYCEARLILDDSSKPDDRAKSSFILSVGADYWFDLTTNWNPSWSVNGDIGIGRFKYVTNDWRAFNMHTLLNETLIKNPPPFK